MVVNTKINTGRVKNKKAIKLVITSKNNFMIKIGQKIKAKWDGVISEIVAIENDIVIYKCFSYENKHLSSDDNYNDGLFRDTKDVILKEFRFI